MSDAFFEKLFGDSEPGHLGTGWMSGTSSVFFGLLGLGGALCLHFPGLLTLPDARAHYPMTIIRLMIQGSIVLAIVLGAISGVLRQRKVLAVTGVSMGLLAAIIGGGSTPLPDEVHTRFGLGLDWFLLDLFVMTVAFLPVERFWPLHPDQKTFRPQWTTDLFYFVATHLPAQLITLGMVIPASYAARWLAIPWLAQTVGTLPFLDPAAAGDRRRGSLAVRHAPDVSHDSLPVALSCDPPFHRNDGLGGGIALALRGHPADARADPHPDDDLRLLAGHVGWLSRVRVLPRDVLPHRFSTADDLAGAVFRDRSLSPLASCRGQGGGGCQLRHPSARSSIGSSERSIFRRTPGRNATAWSAARSRKASSRSCSRRSPRTSFIRGACPRLPTRSAHRYRSSA